ncbi:leucyl/phenylalanyl-tRNA--protein transferase [Flaviramulus basaltis]|uniref:Leucyl/phenylalanyl-tRNA--protein transferase n=1 Tax=Flaviramulus basaltis TaxID=369401 RepID=A0A1K2IB43_9FLAO|nr:leucyl/phenylalanyl-tRNA--protein transferase [Flaviramulus basaltis]SFZ89629.1 leucyl/phenylalanyl-tRNA--protein transferase [Flaviramulus basaltis]
MKYLTQNISFPNVNEASSDGLLAIGGDLSVKRLLLAYKSGIFPWFENEEPILWWSPNPRFVLFPEKLKVSKSMKQVLRNKDYVVTVNKDFKAVITECSKAKREGQAGTWITQSMIDAYIKLHELGYARSVEVWRDNMLVAGLYGVDLGNNVFSGESMFTKESNASKAGFISFIQNTNYKLIDCQVYTSHLESLGAEEISRDLFLKYLEESNSLTL